MVETINIEPKIDVRFNIKSYEQFLIDNKKYNFNKICMTEVINADMMMASYDEEKYYRTSAEILAMGNAAYEQMGISHLIHVYIHSYKTFMAVANSDISDEDFYNLMKTNHEQYELIRGKQTGLSGVSRFAIAFGDDLVNRCLSAYYAHSDKQSNFINVANEKEMLRDEREELTHILEILTYALENDKIIPYFQGIHDNESGEINKYEALMRVFDVDGKIYFPGYFLEASKKLKMYLSLSKALINKALFLFEGKQSTLSINISLYDIKSEDFCAWFLNRLKQHPTPNKVIIEFVETENYNNNEELFDFLQKVRDIGCLIAVDDFGVGYATYSSIISLKPDIIKVDGDIIRTLSTNNDSRMILNSICYMANLIKAETVAEFVENKEIYDIAACNKIKYSQGYYFAKPVSIEELNIL